MEDPPPRHNRRVLAQSPQMTPLAFKLAYGQNGQKMVVSKLATSGRGVAHLPVFNFHGKTPTSAHRRASWLAFSENVSALKRQNPSSQGLIAESGSPTSPLPCFALHSARKSRPADNGPPSPWRPFAGLARKRGFRCPLWVPVASQPSGGYGESAHTAQTPHEVSHGYPH
jgi:hypothetical protein